MMRAVLANTNGRGDAPVTGGEGERLVTRVGVGVAVGARVGDASGVASPKTCSPLFAIVKEDVFTTDLF